MSMMKKCDAQESPALLHGIPPLLAAVGGSAIAMNGENGPGVSYGRMVLQAGCVIAFDAIWSFSGCE
jgi:hypothetical protein